MSNHGSTTLSAAQARVVNNIITEHGDPVIYSNNPAELPGCRYEMDKCLERLGAFEMLIKHNACRMNRNLPSHCVEALLCEVVRRRTASLLWARGRYHQAAKGYIDYDVLS